MGGRILFVEADLSQLGSLRIGNNWDCEGMGRVRGKLGEIDDD